MWADVLKLDTHIVQHLFFEHILFGVSNPENKIIQNYYKIVHKSDFEDFLTSEFFKCVAQNLSSLLYVVKPTVSK